MRPVVEDAAGLVVVVVVQPGSEVAVEHVVEVAVELVVEVAVEHVVDVAVKLVAGDDGGAVHGSAAVVLSAVSSRGLALNAHRTSEEAT